jgi:hypothetical protein
MTETTEYHFAENYMTLSENETSMVIKMDFRTLNQTIAYWSYNRELISNVVDNYYDIVKDNTNPIVWVLTAVKAKEQSQLYLIDGQHRYEAIKKLMVSDIEFNEERFVYIVVYKINSIEEEDEYIIDLFTKINNHAPFNIPDLPSTRNIKIIKTIIKDKILKNGISTNDRTNSCHQPRIHKKTLHAKFNTFNNYIKDMTEEQIIHNLKIINNYIGLKSYLDVYTSKEDSEKQANKNAWEKAKELKFYLGFRNCNEKYTFDNIMININNPELFA